jgi:16S rRNA (cytosine967-C5)-methyltransferase
MTLGVIRRYRTLTWVRDQLVKNKCGHQANGYLLVGLYQLLYMNDVEAYAAVDETVEASKSDLGKKTSAFLNAVLRNVLRERARLEEALLRQPLGVRLSCPDVLVERWAALPCSVGVEEICRWNNRPPHTVLHVCSSKTAADSYRRRLHDARIDAHPHPYAPHRSLVLPRGLRVDELPGYKEGCFFVQDPSAAEAVSLLAPCPGERVLDACAAPGGKAMLIAEAMRGEGRVLAVDKHKDRLGRLEENVRRMGWGNVSVVQGDAQDAASLMAAVGGRKQDAILLDVPCTNTGVLRRRPDARWRFSTERLREHTVVQKQMLTAASRCLKEGGRMVYSTCSIEPEESEGLVREWVATQPGAVCVEERRLYPSERGTDGAYAALIRCSP